MEKIIKDYLEKQIQTDTALKAVYDEKKIGDCVKYIIASARKYLSGKSGGIEDAVVYKWARDFYFGDTDKDIVRAAETEAKCEVIAKETVPEEKPKAKKEKKPAKEKVTVFEPSLFDDME